MTKIMCHCNHKGCCPDEPNTSSTSKTPSPTNTPEKGWENLLMSVIKKHGISISATDDIFNTFRTELHKAKQEGYERGVVEESTGCLEHSQLARADERKKTIEEVKKIIEEMPDQSYLKITEDGGFNGSWDDAYEAGFRAAAKQINAKLQTLN